MLQAIIILTLQVSAYFAMKVMEKSLPLSQILEQVHYHVLTVLFDFVPLVRAFKNASNVKLVSFCKVGNALEMNIQLFMVSLLFPSLSSSLY